MDAHLINDLGRVPIVQKRANENGFWQKKFVEIMIHLTLE